MALNFQTKEYEIYARKTSFTWVYKKYSKAKILSVKSDFLDLPSSGTLEAKIRRSVEFYEPLFTFVDQNEIYRVYDVTNSDKPNYNDDYKQ